MASQILGCSPAHSVFDRYARDGLGLHLDGLDNLTAMRHFDGQCTSDCRRDGCPEEPMVSGEEQERAQEAGSNDEPEELEDNAD